MNSRKKSLRITALCSTLFNLCLLGRGWYANKGTETRPVLPSPASSRAHPLVAAPNVLDEGREFIMNPGSHAPYDHGLWLDEVGEGYKSLAFHPHDVPWNLLKRNPSLRKGGCGEDYPTEAIVRVNSPNQLGINDIQKQQMIPYLTAAFAEVRALEKASAQASTSGDGNPQVVISPNPDGYRQIMEDLKSGLSEILRPDQAGYYQDLLEQDFFLGNFKYPRTIELVTENGIPWLKLSSEVLPWSKPNGDPETEAWMSLDPHGAAQTDSGREFYKLNARYRDLIEMLGLPALVQPSGSR